MSPTARAAFFGWVKEQYESFTKYYFEGTIQEDPETYSYELSELPDGFEEFSRDEIPGKVTIYYANYSTNQMMHFMYSQRTDDGDYFIVTDEYTLYPVIVNDTSAFFYEANNSEQANALIWEDASTKTLFRISAYLDKDTIIRIAEKIKIITE